MPEKFAGILPFPDFSRDVDGIDSGESIAFQDGVKPCWVMIHIRDAQDVFAGGAGSIKDLASAGPGSQQAFFQIAFECHDGLHLGIGELVLFLEEGMDFGKCQGIGGGLVAACVVLHGFLLNGFAGPVKVEMRALQQFPDRLVKQDEDIVGTQGGAFQQGIENIEADGTHAGLSEDPGYGIYIHGGMLS